MSSQYNPDKHHRRSIRLKGYNYTAAGAYFITLCTHQRECLFGKIVDGEMQLSLLGEIVRSNWMNLPKHHSHVQLDAFAIMPNYIHGILILADDTGLSNTIDRDFNAGSSNQPECNRSECKGGFSQDSFTLPQETGSKPASTRVLTNTKRHGIPEIVRGFKTFSARRINHIRKSAGIPMWQCNYYEHIIRNDRALQQIRQYIQNNPLSWEEDQLHPNNSSKW